MYRVALLDDDRTAMEFVVSLLEHVFGKERDEAVRIMLHIHKHGSAEVGVSDRSGAEQKVAQVRELAQKHQHSLQCVMEEK